MTLDPPTRAAAPWAYVTAIVLGVALLLGVFALWRSDWFQCTAFSRPRGCLVEADAAERRGDLTEAARLRRDVCARSGRDRCLPYARALALGIGLRRDPIEAQRVFDRYCAWIQAEEGGPCMLGRPLGEVLRASSGCGGPRHVGPGGSNWRADPMLHHWLSGYDIDPQGYPVVTRSEGACSIVAQGRVMTPEALEAEILERRPSADR